MHVAALVLYSSKMRCAFLQSHFIDFSREKAGVYLPSGMKTKLRLKNGWCNIPLSLRGRFTQFKRSTLDPSQSSPLAFMWHHMKACSQGFSGFPRRPTAKRRSCMYKSKDEPSASDIAAPFMALLKASQNMAKSLGNAEESHFVRAPVLQNVSSQGPPAVAPCFINLVADLPHSFLSKNGTSVKFYLYRKLDLIRITARNAEGLMKERLFTKQMASEMGVRFDFVSAEAWIRKVGFKDVPLSDQYAPQADIPDPAPQPVMQPSQEAARQPIPEPRPVPAQARENVPPKPAPANPVASGNGKPPKPAVSGTLMSFGIEECKGFDGKPDYKAYAIRVQGRNTGRPQRFVGEQLAELVEQQGLKVGDEIRVTPLGSLPFQVNIHGKMVDRHRNSFAITKL